MKEEVKDAGLVAMISSILGGNKRADIFAPAIPPEIPASAAESQAETQPETQPETLPESWPDQPAGPADTGAVAAEAAEPKAPVAEKLVEPPAPVPMTADGKRLLPADAIAELVLSQLRKLEHFPETGVSITVYGYRPWNAMIAFAPFSTTSQHAARFREAVPEIVFKLRRLVELAI